MESDPGWPEDAQARSSDKDEDRLHEQPKSEDNVEGIEDEPA